MLTSLVNHFKKIDFWVYGSILIIIFLSLDQLYFIEKLRGPEMIFIKQLIFFIIGIIISLAISYFPCEILKTRGVFVFFLYFLSLILLFSTSLFARAKRGVEGWLDFKYFDVQPVELMKITLLLVLAKYFATRQLQIFRLKTIFISCLYILAPVFLTVKQPDLGSAAILVIIWFGVAFLSGIKLKHFLIFILILIIFLTSAWDFLSAYQKARLIAFFFPEKDPLGENYSTLQAEIAIGSGGLWGRGEENSFQTAGGFLPEPHTDFIFASFVERKGFLWSLILFTCYFILLNRLIKFALLRPNLNEMLRLSNFGRIFSLGLAILIFAHILINIGINLRLFPVTGIPLSFFSYGGSHLLSLFIAIGIYQSFYTRVQGF